MADEFEEIAHRMHAGMGGHDRLRLYPGPFQIVDEVHVLGGDRRLRLTRGHRIPQIGLVDDLRFGQPDDQHVFGMVELIGMVDVDLLIAIGQFVAFLHQHVVDLPRRQ